MKKIISLMLAVLMVPISYAQEMNGTWKGILNAGNQELEIVFHFNYQENGNSTAKMDLLMAYTGKLTDGTIKGTFNQFGRSFPLDLKPGEAAKPDRPQEPE